MYFIGKEDNDGNVTYLKWKYKTEKDGSYVRFSHELMKLCEKYQYCFGEENIPCEYHVRDDPYEICRKIDIDYPGKNQFDLCTCGGDKMNCCYYKYDEKTGKLK